MADSSRPKGPAGETPTRQFQLKLDGWMEEFLKNDLDPDAPPNAAPPEPPPADPESTRPPKR